MKKYLLFIPVLFIGMFFFMGQKSQDGPSPKWFSPFTPVSPSSQYGMLPLAPEYDHAVSQPKILNTRMGTYVISPNIRVRPTSSVSQTELALVSHPTLPILLGGSNSAKLSGGSFINDGVYVSTNNGLTWYGSDTLNAPNLNDQRGDPGPTINKDGRFIMTHLTSTANFGGVTGMGANYSTNNGLTWSATYQISSSTQDDKNLAWSDPRPTSPYYGHSYMAWVTFTGGTSGNSSFSRTTNGGVSWTPPITINSTPAGHFAQGHDVRSGPNGEVYVSWVAENAASPFTADYMGFAKSTNGGANFTALENAIDMNGSRSFNFGGWGTRVNDFTRMDVDLTGGPRNGWIYVVNTQNSLAPAGNDPDVILSRSTNGGVNWTAHRVNQDALNNGKSQWFPVVNVDATGGVNVVFYDNRNFPVTDSAAIFIARSLDGGTTFEDFEITDHHFKPIPDPNFGGGYYGDYIGLTSSNGKLHAFWMDNKAGVYNAWHASVVVANNPLNAFNLTSPAAGTIITGVPGSSSTVTFNWDTSGSGASYKWIFGGSLPTRQLTVPTGSNSLTLTLSQVDAMLAGLGVAPGGQIVGSWDAWAFRPNPPANDSLKAANGPRSLTLRRALPTLSAFNLLNPPTNTTIVTSGFNNSSINFNWTRSGAGTTYKWKFGAPTLSTLKFTVPSNGSGFDSVYTVVNSTLDQMLGSAGVAPGDSLAGQWAVYAYNGSDSLKSVQTFNLTLKRQAKGDVLVAYDSTAANCIVSRDSVTNNLNQLGVTFDLFNKGGQTATSSISFRGYKKVILLGEGTSTFSTVVKDSLKAYMNSGGTTLPTKSKVIIFSEDVGYNYGRTGSTYLDLNFVNTYLGFDYMADAPGGSSGAQGLVGDIINNAMIDSTSGPWPDVLKKNTTSGTHHVLYRFRKNVNNPDSANAVGSYYTTFNVAVFGVDVESIRSSVGGPTGSAVRRFVKGALDYVDGIGVGVENENIIPTVYDLAQNYPNPFNPVTKINFAIPKQGIVNLRVYDITGREIAVLVNEVKTPGVYSVDFNGVALSSGVYFYRIEASDYVQTRKMLLVK